MKIQIDGVNTNNKGAELMLCSVIKEIEIEYPNSEVYINLDHKSDLTFLDTNLEIHQRYVPKYSRYFIKVCSLLGIQYSYFTPKYVFKKIDILFDAGGFQFSDQFFNNWGDSVNQLKIEENYYKKLKKQNTKIIFLPQAFGPFNTVVGEKVVEIISRYADIVYAREKTSFDYLIKSGMNKDKLCLSTDFTSNIIAKEVLFDNKQTGKVCIIPNKKMLTHTSANLESYLKFVKTIINEFKSREFDVFILNHEGSGDLVLGEKINELFSNKLDVVSGLNAYEVKSLIGSSSFVISSRYHGVASALNQSVPCLATSWSHKYALLFKDYGQENMLLHVDSTVSEIFEKIKYLIDNKETIKKSLTEYSNKNKRDTKEMWENIWKFII